MALPVLTKKTKLKGDPFDALLYTFDGAEAGRWKHTVAGTKD
jgi:hypothetical protein